MSNSSGSDLLQKAKQVNELRDKTTEQLATQLDTFFKTVLEYSHRQSGAGSYYSQFHKSLSKIDRYGIRAITPNNEHAGLTFITRPKLNLLSGNLRQNRLLSLLDTEDRFSIQFMIRALLDTKISSLGGFSRTGDTASGYLASNAYSSPLIDSQSPFITPLMNCLESISGFPSSNIETFTTDGGFFSEDLSFAVGSDRNRKSFDLQLSFVDIQGGICNALIQMWMEYIAAVSVGEMIPYYEDIHQQRLGYTCSIYRFLLDPSKRFITRWCKCTGGFPISRPSGAAFDLNHGESFVEATKKMSVTFKFNHMGTDSDPIILKEFNMLMEKFCPGIANSDGSESIYTKTTNLPENNYTGLPYIVYSQYGPELQFRSLPQEKITVLESELKAQAEAIAAAQAQLNSQIDQINNSSTTTDVTYV